MPPRVFILVCLLNTGDKSFWYQTNFEIVIGSIVRVPLRNKTVYGVVTMIQHEHPLISGTIKDIYAIERFPEDNCYIPFIQQLSDYYQIGCQRFFSRLLPFFLPSLKKFDLDVIPVEQPQALDSEVVLTVAQQHIVDFVCPEILAGRYLPTVLYGATGSGKTEIYKKLVSCAINAGKTVLLLLPEVTLALEFEKKFNAAYQNVFRIYSFHCATPLKMRKQMWDTLMSGNPALIIGVHLPIFLPIERLGCIIVDEEHEVGYQEKNHPKINSREAAIMRAQLYQIPIILGSATPSVSSLYNVTKRGWHLKELGSRFAGSFPIVQTVVLPLDVRRSNFWISRVLEKALADRLSKGEQSILFLNRRGFSFFLQCGACGFVPRCTRCSVSLTVHEKERLMCHYCSYTVPEPKACPHCASKSIVKKGIGTQQIVTILKKIFPKARIARADLDTTAKKNNWQNTIHEFSNGLFDILVGTQSITKGYNFKGVTLVGAIWADVNLNIPIFNASETTLQQLIQVSGRAGRFCDSSQVIMQTMSDHQIFSHINEKEYLSFFACEILLRAELHYPPCARLVEIELKHKDDVMVEKEAGLVFSALVKANAALALSVIVLGPAKPLVHQIKKISSRKIYLKSARFDDIQAVYRLAIDRMHLRGKIFFTPNPVN